MTVMEASFIGIPIGVNITVTGTEISDSNPLNRKGKTVPLPNLRLRVRAGMIGRPGSISL